MKLLTIRAILNMNLTFSVSVFSAVVVSCFHKSADAFSVPPESVTIAKNYHLKAGEKSRLICHSKFSNPEAEIGWEFPGMGSANFTEEKRFLLRYYSSMMLHSLGLCIVMSLTALYRFVTWLLFRDNGNNGFDVSNTIEFIPTKVMDKAIVACFALSSKWARVNSSEYRLNVQCESHATFLFRSYRILFSHKILPPVIVTLSHVFLQLTPCCLSSPVFRCS